MSYKPLTYFTAISIAIHATLFGVWSEPDRPLTVSRESSIEIGLVTLPRIDEIFSTKQVQLHAGLRQQPEMEAYTPASSASNSPPIIKKDNPSIDRSLGNNDQVDAAVNTPARVKSNRSDSALSGATDDNSPLVATDAAPLASTNPAPRYPEEALRYGWEGEVWLKVDVDRSGAVYRVRVDRSSGYPALDRAALKTVQRWLFEPARIGNEAVDATVRVPVRFHIKRS